MPSKSFWYTSETNRSKIGQLNRYRNNKAILSTFCIWYWTTPFLLTHRGSNTKETNRTWATAANYCDGSAKQYQHSNKCATWKAREPVYSVLRPHLQVRIYSAREVLQRRTKVYSRSCWCGLVAPSGRSRDRESHRRGIPSKPVHSIREDCLHPTACWGSSESQSTKFLGVHCSTRTVWRTSLQSCPKNEKCCRNAQTRWARIPSGLVPCLCLNLAAEKKKGSSSVSDTEGAEYCFIVSVSIQLSYFRSVCLWGVSKRFWWHQNKVSITASSNFHVISQQWPCDIGKFERATGFLLLSRVLCNSIQQ